MSKNKLNLLGTEGDAGAVKPLNAVPILLDNSDDNADWIKLVKDKNGKTAREREAEIHAQLAKSYEEQAGSKTEG